MRKILLPLLFSVFIVSKARTQSDLRMTFTASDTSFLAAAQEYDNIWKTDGTNIINALEQTSGLKFIDTAITVIIYESPSYSGDNVNSPMKLRGSYPHDTKKATIVHELGHRLNFAVKQPPGHNDHQLLFLYLYDVWVALYGQHFADEQVKIESSRSNPRNDYKSMWEKVLSMSKKERSDKLKQFLKGNW